MIDENEANHANHDVAMQISDYAIDSAKSPKPKTFYSQSSEVSLSLRARKTLFEWKLGKRRGREKEREEEEEEAEEEDVENEEEGEAEEEESN